MTVLELGDKSVMARDNTPPESGQPEQSHLRDLGCLYEITRSLATAARLQDCLGEVMAVLAREKGMDRGTVTIINQASGELEIEVAHGIPAEARRRGRYRLGEGITGRVVASGEPIVVPHIADEPLFLNRTRARGELERQRHSFLCVPIRQGNETIGALSIDREYRNGLGEASANDQRFLSVVSGLIAETARRIQQVNQEQEVLLRENVELRQQLTARNRVEEFIGNSSRMQEVYEMIHRVADSAATVLLRGESGTGKTQVAKALHQHSRRKNEPFIAVNCAALPETLLESELFGHEKGAFTGAHTRKKGRFELAGAGTLFLDEIGELSPAVQVKLLNAVQDRSFIRLGGSEAIPCKARLVAATNRDLEKAVQDRSFREDLYYRLNVFPLFLPPLRERRTDILLLAEHFLEKYAAENNKQIRRISTPAIDLLMKYHWPGNVRELQNCMERAVLICDGESIQSIHLPPSLQSPDSINAERPQSLAAAVENFERELLIDALKQTNGNQSKASQLLDTTIRIINYKIKRYNIDPRRYKIR